MIYNVDDCYKSWVEIPCKRLIEKLDDYDKVYDGYINSRPPRLNEFLEYDRKKQIDLAKASDDKKKKEIENTHFGITPDFIKSIDTRIKDIDSTIARIKQEKFEIDVNIIPAIISKDATEKEISYREGVEAEFGKVMDEIEMLRSMIIEDNINENNRRREEFASNNEVFYELQDKKEILEQYSDDIMNNCSLWGISLLDLDIDNSTFTAEELNNLYDKYIDAMEKECDSPNIIAKFRSIVKEPYMQGGVILIILILCFTPLLNILSMVFFGAIGYGMVKNKNKAKYYSVLAAITFRIDPMQMISSGIGEENLLPEILTDEMLDEDPRFDKFISMLDEVEEHEDFADAVVYQEALSNYSTKQKFYSDEVKRYNKIWQNKLEAIICDLTDEATLLKDTRAKAISDYEKFGDRFAKELYFSPTFTLGLKGELDEEYFDVGLNNVIIRPTSNVNQLNLFLRVLYVNIITHVNPTNLNIYIFDPNERGSLFMPFYCDDLRNIVKFYNDNLSDIIDELRTIADTNLKELQGYTIHEYNERADKEGLTPKKYHVLFILSQPKNIEEDESLRAFFDYSTDVGIMIYAVSSNIQSANAVTFRRPFQSIENPLSICTDQWCREFSQKHVKAIKRLTPKGGILWQDFISNVFTTDQFWSGNGTSFIDMYPGYLNGDPTEHPIFPFGNEGDIHMLGVGGTGAGKSVFINHCIGTCTWLYSPKELELWLADFKGVEFQFYLGNEKFPAILPHMAACLCTADPDFATSLFKAFRNMADFRYEEMKAAGVKNMPGWNGQVVQNVNVSRETGQPMRKPSSLIELHSNDKTPYDPLWSDDDYWPRVLFIVDEFQVIFEKADPKNLESINADITQISKVARAAGAHIFFTSQSMKKTVSADILNQFSLRFGLRCAEDTSMEIMGSKLSSSITAKNGWLYVKTIALKPEEAKFIRTPFIEDQEEKKYRALTLEVAGVDYSKDSYVEGAEKLHASPLHMHIARCADEAKRLGFVRKNPPVTYAESDKCVIEELEETYNNPAIIAKLPESGVFFLGDRMAYSSNQAPENIILGNKNNTHIFSLFSDLSDATMFFRSIMYNIKHNRIEEKLWKEREAELTNRLNSSNISNEDKDKFSKQLEEKCGQTVLISISSSDIGYLCEADKYLDSRTSRFYSEKTTPHSVFEWAENLMNSRKSKCEQLRTEDEKNSVKKPVWIICLGWDKMKGVGVDPDSMLKLKMNTVLNLCGEFGIHFIFICTGLGKINDALFNNFNFLISGRVDSDTSIMFLKSKVAAKSEPKNGWMYIKNKGELTRLKIYQSQSDRKIESDEIVL